MDRLHLVPNIEEKFGPEDYPTRITMHNRFWAVTCEVLSLHQGQKTIHHSLFVERAKAVGAHNGWYLRHCLLEYESDIPWNLRHNRSIIFTDDHLPHDTDRVSLVCWIGWRWQVKRIELSGEWPDRLVVLRQIGEETRHRRPVLSLISG